MDTYLGGHAVVLVGYQDNSPDDPGEHRPGGGYFVFRNSWGQNWAPGNNHAPGYGFLPYSYAEQFCLEAAVIDELANASVESEGPPDPYSRFPPSTVKTGTKKTAKKGAKKPASRAKKNA